MRWAWSGRRPGVSGAGRGTRWSCWCRGVCGGWLRRGRGLTGVGVALGWAGGRGWWVRRGRRHLVAGRAGGVPGGLVLRSPPEMDEPDLLSFA